MAKSARLNQLRIESATAGAICFHRFGRRSLRNLDLFEDQAIIFFGDFVRTIGQHCTAFSAHDLIDHFGEGGGACGDGDGLFISVHRDIGSLKVTEERREQNSFQNQNCRHGLFLKKGRGKERGKVSIPQMFDA